MVSRMTNVITVYQPSASLIMAGVKTWETRGNPPHGDMRPDGVRGLPGRRVNAGDRVAIHAAAKPVRTLPTEMITSAWIPGSFDQPWSWGDEIVDILGRDREAQDALEADIAEHGIREGVHLGPDMRVWDGHHRIVAAMCLGIKEIPISKDSLPTGVILGTVEVVRVLPVGSMPGCEYLADDLHVCLNGNGRLDLVDHDNGDYDITDQLLYGHWLPGNWGWELADPIPTTEQCPDGCTRFHGRMPGHVYGSNWDWVPCQTCGGAMTCPPIPVKGKQGVWEWTA